MPALALLAAGVCAAAAEASLTPTAYRAQANAICGKAKRQVDALGKPRNELELARYVVRLVRIQGRELATLRKLEPPRSLRVLHARALVAIAAELDLLDGALLRMHQGQHARVALAPTQGPLTQLTRQEDAAWRKAGVRVCAQD